MQLLYVANRHERKPEIEQALAAGVMVVVRPLPGVEHRLRRGPGPRCEVAGAESSEFLPRPDLTILLDIAPETAARRKAAGRDRYERDLALLSRVRDSYRRQAHGHAGWLRLDGERPRDAVSADVVKAVATRLAPR